MAKKKAQVIGYCRVPTDRRNAERQMGEILTNCKANRLGDPVIVCGTASGHKESPELERILASLKTARPRWTELTDTTVQALNALSINDS